MATETDAGGRTLPDAPTLVGYLHTATYVLTALLGVSLLLVGTVAIIAELKGTWHWAIHLESTISYMALFVAGVLALLIPAFVLSVLGRRVVDDA